MAVPRYLEFYRSEDFFRCEIECRRAIAQDPAIFNPHLVLCVSLTRLGKYLEAIEQGLNAINLVHQATAEQRSRLLHAVGDAALELDRLSEAIGYYRSSLALSPERPKGLYALSQALYLNNEFEACQEVLEQMFEAGNVPDDIYAYAVYTYSTLNSDLGLEDFFGRFPRVKKSVNHHLFFHGVANLLVNQHQPSLAVQCYDAGNKLRRSSEPYSFQTEMEVFNAHLRHVDSEMSSISHEFSERNPVPIFVVGMPRTGSSLLEQMLGAHSSVAPTGETGWLMESLRSVLGVDSDSAAFVRGIDNLQDKEWVLNLRSRYLDHADDLQTKCFVDKTLGNFQLLWLIKVAFPEALVIHCARERGPTVWSCYKTSFRRGVRFSESIEETTIYFDKVEELIDRWGDKFDEQLLRVQYEELIANPEGMIRRILSHLGLEFEAETLKPSEQSRIVNTASKVQVTKPIFKRPNKEYEPFRDIVEPRITKVV